MALYVVTGPPGSGKTTWVASHAQRGDITVDFDALASVLTPTEAGEHKFDGMVVKPWASGRA